ncbi:MAG: hypothetical protein AAFR41_08260 [Pseudomonadota bacterium]
MIGDLANSRLGFDPFLPWPVLTALAGAAFLVWFIYFVLHGRAWLTRFVALALVVAALANPSLVEEEREPLSSVAALVLDRSESMTFGDRSKVSEETFAAVRAALEADDSLEIRVAETDPKADGTTLFSSLEGLMADVPRNRVAGAIFITDGQVHDVPQDLGRVSDLGPVHALVVGDSSRGDRRAEIVEGPSFGIVGEEVQFIVRADDPGGGDIPLSISMNGNPPRIVTVRSGQDTPVSLEVERRGENIVVVEAPPGEEELTLANNRTAAILSGTFDRLRVLLITGKPNAAGRVWRDLLKSDPQVDLVHFTILRPPYKQDITPIEELALIQFPTDELFEEKLPEFDLIIFDQYERTGVVTQSYLANMARYVEEGGALVLIAGEAFAGPASLARTPLAGVLPAIPSGAISIGPFKPELTDAGTRHTVTNILEGQAWGGWMRYVSADAAAGDVLLESPGGDPLLVVDRVGSGRVGLLLSDQIWLWARGHDGGGPFSELIRRMVHWMMKEPELEERKLDLTAQDGLVRARLRSLSDQAPPLALETPEGNRVTLDWTVLGPGDFVAETAVDQMGLYRASAGGLDAVALNGPANPREYVDLRATTSVLLPVSDATRGGAFELGPDGRRRPEIRRVGRTGAAAGGNWLGLRERGAYLVKASSSQPLLPAIAAALLATLFLLIAWRREGR